jgi:hypothetical protein
LAWCTFTSCWLARGWSARGRFVRGSLATAIRQRLELSLSLVAPQCCGWEALELDR